MVFTANAGLVVNQKVAVAGLVTLYIGVRPHLATPIREGYMQLWMLTRRGGPNWPTGFLWKRWEW